jgi:uncharacterized membrane protein YhaH (DUF805 family)
MPTIILSYRRDDTGAIAGRIFDRLVGHYGADQVFMDIDSIPLGLDFREHIQETLTRCDVLLAIIGPRWAAPDQKGGFRINEENDWVRIEVEAALAKKIPVIPVLIDDAELPPPTSLPDKLRDLAFRQAAPVDSGRDFHPHMDRLIKAMDRLMSPAKPAPPPVAPKVARRSEPRSSPKRAALPDQVADRTEPTREDGKSAKPYSPPETDRAAVTSRVSRVKSLLWSGFRALITRPRGRIARKTFWIAAVEGVFATLFLFWLTAYFLGALVGVSDREAGLALCVAVGLAAWVWSTMTVGIKRLHDRNRRGRWIAIPIAWEFLVAWTIVAKFGPRNLDILNYTLLLGSPVALWVLIDLGILKGTEGPNRYGPDPLSQPSPTQ